MRSNVVSEASLSTRVGQYWAGIPAVTRSVVVLCSGIYFAALLLGYDSFDAVCFWPSQVVDKFQVYRAYTSILVHVNIMHVVFNMLAFVPIGNGLERTFGSVRYFHVLLMLCTSNALVHLVIAYLGAFNPVHRFPFLLQECGIGLSGVIFSLIVIETTLSGAQNRNIFGLFNVPAKWYVWVLLLLFQLLMPHVSFVGHLSGVLSGYLYAMGLFNPLLLAPSTYVAIEESSLLAPFVRRPEFIIGGSAFVGTLPTVLSTSGANTLRNLQSFFPQQQPTTAAGDQCSTTPSVDTQRFPGRGQTIGNSGNSAAQPPTAGVSSTPLRSFPAPKPQTAPQHDPGLVEQDNRQVADSAAVRSLVAMGFPKEQATFALAATNGDVNLAVEVLSSEGQV